RFAYTIDNPRIEVPGISRLEWWFGNRGGTHHQYEATVREFDHREFQSIRGKVGYIKLHGSADWRTADGRTVVWSGAKEAAINRFPVLRMNSAIFRKALAEPGARLLVIGYGFGDEHINATILQGAKAGLKL